MTPPTPDPLEIAEIWLYPIKACAGFRVTQTKVERRGLLRDRAFMVVDEAGRFFTQREEPKLQAVRTRLTPESIVMTTPVGSCVLPLEMNDGPRMNVTVWDSECEALEHVEGSKLLSATLERPLKLVYMPADVQREVDEKYAVAGDIVSFADAFPLLLASVASLDDLNTALDEAVTMERFRPNLVVRGARAYEEEEWTQLRIADTSFRAVTTCTRCAVVNVDPVGATRRSKQPLATLSAHHAQKGKPIFGVNLIPDRLGSIQVGDRLIVV